MIPNYNPDVLSCLSNLSNDEVSTPPNVAKQMLDILPKELWSDKNATFLDPCAKSGVFLREIAKRLIEGLKDEIPDLQTRLNHIYTKQLFGLAITEMTSLMARRTLYCSKFANGKYSVCTEFETEQGNIFYQSIQHTWDKGRCVYCGASQSEYDRDESLESHAYAFIHDEKELSTMKFDVIIGNPPYQLNDGGAQASASPLYHKFVEQAKKLNPRYLTMIIPSRWFAGGKGLDDFREAMLNDKHLKELYDFPNTDDCFPGVNIRGGVCYFLIDNSYDNTKSLVKVVTHDKETLKISERSMKYKNLDIFVRYNEALSILHKIDELKEQSLSEYISSRKPFGLATDFAKSDLFKATKPSDDYIACYGKSMQVGYVHKDLITAHQNWIEKWKVITPYVNNIGTELNDDNQNAFVSAPYMVCTETYIVVGADLELDENTSNNVVTYLKTKFARFLHSLAKASQHATAKTYRFVPLQDFSETWTDEKLYAKYGLTPEEIAFIESMVRPMEASLYE